MKKLPYCTLLAGAFFVVFATRMVFRLTNHIEPFGLLCPLLWDLMMVGIGLGFILKCEIARKAGMAWAIFCIAASLAMGVAALIWILHPRYESPGAQRIFFVTLAIVFGLIFGVWQLLVLRHPDSQAWTDPAKGPVKHAAS